MLDTVGGETLARSFAVVRSGGAVVSLCAMLAADALRGAGFAVPWFMGALLPVMSWKNSRRARSAGVRLSGQVTLPSRARLETLAGIAASRGLQVSIDRTFPFEELPQALDHAASGKARGRVVVTL